jgi:hypothetical protein
MRDPATSPANRPFLWTERAALCTLVAAALALGFANLGRPSLWHDECVHVFVAKSMAETGVSAHPSGYPYALARIYHVVLVVAMGLFGDSEAALRSPSVLFHAVNVVLTWLLVGKLAGRGTGLAAAALVALSPWSVAWARQARFYALQQTCYLALLLAFWEAARGQTLRKTLLWTAASAACLLAGMMTSVHSLVFIAAPGAHMAWLALRERRWVSRWSVLLALTVLAGALGLAAIYFLVTDIDRMVLFKNAGLGGGPPSPHQSRVLLYRWFYFRWLWQNLGVGWYLLAMAGTVLAIPRHRAGGLLLLLGFWAPALALTFLVTYRWDRFLFFAYPLYCGLAAVGLVSMMSFIGRTLRARRNPDALAAPPVGWLSPRLRLPVAWCATALLLVFSARLAVSATRLTWDSLEAASGADVTLARRIPQWRMPSLYVLEHLAPGDVVITTTALPVMYYVGQADAWFPARTHPWERLETNVLPLDTRDDLAAFLREHPSGWFLAEFSRLTEHRVTAGDLAFVRGHMTHVPEASSGDVDLYTWGTGPER